MLVKNGGVRVAAIALLLAVASAGAGQATVVAPVHAALANRGPCAAALPQSLAGIGGVHTHTRLTGGGVSFDLYQYGHGGLNAESRRAGVTPPTGDAVATFSLASGGHRYTGVTHVFARGGRQQLCMLQPIYYDYSQSASYQAHPQNVEARLSGALDGGQAHIDLYVDTAAGRSHFSVYGATSTTQGIR